MTGWPPKDWRALIALLGSVAGAAMLTIFVWWGCSVLLPDSKPWTAQTEAHRAFTIRWVLWIAVATISMVIIGLGFAINRRSFKGSVGTANFEFAGGEDDQVPPKPIEIPNPAYAKVQ